MMGGKDGFTGFVDKKLQQLHLKKCQNNKKIQKRRVGCKLANNTVLSTARFVQTASILHDFKVYICKTQLRHQVHIIHHSVIPLLLNKLNFSCKISAGHS